MSRLTKGASGTLQSAIEAAYEAGLIDNAVFAESLADRTRMWAFREQMSEVQSKEGASIKHDVSVPIVAVPELIEAGVAAAERLVPGIRPVPFGHMGDGNIHMNLQQPVGMDPAAFLARSHDIMDTVNEVVRDLGGSFSAEHGIGRLKTDMMEDWRGGAELDVMQRIKGAIDPRGLMNPGKVLP